MTDLLEGKYLVILDENFGGRKVDELIQTSTGPKWASTRAIPLTAQ